MKVFVCGCGAIGSNLIDTLVRQGIKADISVVDFDRVEEKNIATQVWNYDEIGQLKVLAMQNRCYLVNKTQIETFDKKLDDRTIKKFLKGVKNTDLVVDCFDNSESRRLLKEHCDSNDIRCLHGGLFEGYGEIIWNDSYIVPANAKGDVCDNPIARNLILLLVSVMAEQIRKYIAGEIDEYFGNYTITLKDLQIRKERNCVKAT